VHKSLTHRKKGLADNHDLSGVAVGAIARTRRDGALAGALMVIPFLIEALLLRDFLVFLLDAEAHVGLPVYWIGGFRMLMLWMALTVFGVLGGLLGGTGIEALSGST